MNDKTKLELAKDIIATYVAKTAKLLDFDLNNDELKELLLLKEEVDRNNLEAINYVLGLSDLGEITKND